MTSKIQGPPPLTVSWSCRRCGHQGGMAQTLIPVVGWDEPMIRPLLDDLRKKLVTLHYTRQHCVAVVEDFVIQAYVSPAHTLVGRV
jgi:hypothetical protein